jgi:hypothetical protein
VTKMVLLTDGYIQDVADLKSTQEEADTRLILNTMYSVQNKNIDHVIIHSSDTDVVVMVVHYAGTLLTDLPELWVRTSRKNDLPIHEIVSALGPCPSSRVLGVEIPSVIHISLARKSWMTSSKNVHITALENYAEYPVSFEITIQLYST